MRKTGFGSNVQDTPIRKFLKQTTKRIVLGDYYEEKDNHINSSELAERNNQDSFQFCPKAKD